MCENCCRIMALNNYANYLTLISLMHLFLQIEINRKLQSALSLIRMKNEH